MNCPDCGGPTWDNRLDKRNPKSPDYKCKNKACGKGVWLDKKETAAPAPSNGNAGNGHAPVHATPSTQRALGPLYNECLDFAKKACVHHFGDLAAPTDIIASAATLFIQAVNDGAPIRPAAKPAVAPPPPPPPVAAHDPYDDNRPLPF